MNNKSEAGDRRKTFKQYVFVIRQLASKELKHRNASRRFGYFWNILIPFVDMITLSILFAKVFNTNIYVFVPYIFTGTIIYSFYSNGMFGSLSALAGNRNLLIRTKIPKNIFVIEKIYIALIQMAFSIVGYIIILSVLGVKVGPFAGLFPVAVLFSVFITLGIGKILAVVNVYFADIKHFYLVAMRLVYYGSALFYHSDRLSPVMQEIIGFNPIFLSISFARTCVLYNSVPDITVWIKLIVYSAAIYIAGTILFRKKTQDIVAEL